MGEEVGQGHADEIQVLLKENLMMKKKNSLICTRCRKKQEWNKRKLVILNLQEQTKGTNIVSFTKIQQTTTTSQVIL